MMPRAGHAGMQVGIVNDIRVIAESLRRIVADMPGFEVAWVAHSGEAALAHHGENPADIVLMDLIMPGLDGAQTTEAMMKVHPCAILVVTATVIGNRSLVFAAMGKGALDAVNTPDASSTESAGELRRKLITVSRLVKSAAVRPSPEHLSGKHLRTMSGTVARAVAPHDHEERPPAIIGIGASTGGPQAIATILKSIPPHVNAAIIIVQHLDRQFVPGLERWLQRESRLPIQLAKEDEPIQRGIVYLADSENHLVCLPGKSGNMHLHYTEHPRDTPHRPSVDVFFESLALLRNGHRCGVLLTGMGGDGAIGLLALRQAGAPTWAQDPESCVVYGMPAVAFKIGAVSEPTPLKEIAPRLLEFAGQTPARTQKSLR